MVLNKTVRELFAYSDGTTCPETEALLAKYYPGWTLDTVINVYEWLEHHKTERQEVYALVSVFKAMSAAEVATLITWARSVFPDTKTGRRYIQRWRVIAIKNDLVNNVLKCRFARKLLNDEGITDTAILNKCVEVMGLTQS